MSGVIVTDPPKASAEDVEALARYGVATVHEAMGRTGLLGTHLRPIQQDTRVAGTAVTVLSWPGDNLMIHACVEQCGPGDVLVVGVTADNSDGMFGDLLATSLMARGVIGLVIDAGVRDVKSLTEMRFPVWAKAISGKHGKILERIGVHKPVYPEADAGKRVFDAARCCSSTRPSPSSSSTENARCSCPGARCVRTPATRAGTRRASRTR